MASVTDWQCELTYTDDVGVVYGNNNNNIGYKIHGIEKLPNVAYVLSFTQEKAAGLPNICRVLLRTRQKQGEK